MGHDLRPLTCSQPGLSVQATDHAATANTGQRGIAGHDAPQHPMGEREHPPLQSIPPPSIP